MKQELIRFGGSAPPIALTEGMWPEATRVGIPVRGHPAAHHRDKPRSRATGPAIRTVLLLTIGWAAPSQAQFDLQQLQQSKFERAIRNLVNEPPRHAWFLIDGKWTWSTTHDAVPWIRFEPCADRVSIRLLSWLRSISPLPPERCYLFVLFALALGVRVISLPILVQTLKVSAKCKALRPELVAINVRHRANPARMIGQMMDLYKVHGVRGSVVCLSLLVDVLFGVWFVLVAPHYSPRVQLDGSAFLWVADVTRFNMAFAAGIALFMIVRNLAIHTISRGFGLYPSATGQIIFFMIILIVGWYWSWPSYVFILWLFLVIVGGVMTQIIVLAHQAWGGSLRMDAGHRAAGVVDGTCALCIALAVLLGVPERTTAAPPATTRPFLAAPAEHPVADAARVSLPSSAEMPDLMPLPPVLRKLNVQTGQSKAGDLKGAQL